MLDLGYVTVKGRSHQMTAPAPSYTQSATLGDSAELIGYDLEAADLPAAPGGRLRVTLYWRALGATATPYTVFVHLVGSDGSIAGYGDAEPGDGALPTTGWARGEYLTDFHTIAVDAAAAPGVYNLVVGLYDPATGQRLATPGGEDHVVLGTSVRVGPR